MHSGLLTQPRRARQHQFGGDVIQSEKEIVVDTQVYSDNNSSVQHTNTLFMWGKFLQSSMSTATIQDISIHLESIPDFSLSREERDNISSELTSFSQNKKLLSILRYIRTITVLCNVRIHCLCGVNSYRAPRALELSQILPFI